MPKPRRKLPIMLRNAIFDQARCACSNPECQAFGVSVLEIHHRDGNPVNNTEENLIALCGTCHTRAEKGIISEADLDLWKRMLVAGFHPRLGQANTHTTSSKSAYTNIGVNQGSVQSAEKIVNDYRGAKRPPLGPAPDSIGAHSAERSYLEYLRKRYIKCRLKEKQYGDKRPFNPAQASNTFEKVLGYAPLQAPLSSFDQTWRRLHELVCGTVGAVRYMRGYRPKTWQEHQDLLASGASMEES